MATWTELAAGIIIAGNVEPTFFGGGYVIVPRNTALALGVVFLLTCVAGEGAFSKTFAILQSEPFSTFFAGGR